jgi:hypothetical protein
MPSYYQAQPITTQTDTLSSNIERLSASNSIGINRVQQGIKKEKEKQMLIVIARQLVAPHIPIEPLYTLYESVISPTHYLKFVYQDPNYGIKTRTSNIAKSRIVRRVMGRALCLLILITAAVFITPIKLLHQTSPSMPRSPPRA